MRSVRVSRKAKALIFDPAGVSALEKFLPEMVKIPGSERAAVPHNPYTTRVMRRLGFKVPSPIYTSYDWSGTNPFRAQKATAAMLVTEPRAFVLSDMGTGKTRSALYAFDYLRKNTEVRRMLIVAPLSTLNFTWGREITFNFPQYRFGVAHGTKKRREEVVKDRRLDIVIVNHHGVKTMQDLLTLQQWDVIVIDEVAVFRNTKTKLHKSMAKVAQGMKYLWGMTGTPTPRAPTDAFGIIKLITPSNPVAKSFIQFRDKLMVKHGPFEWTPRPGATEHVYRLMQPAVRFTMDECVDIPPITFDSREVALSPRQKRAYEELRKNAVAMHEGAGITAANAAALLTKLTQVACGVVYDTNKMPIFLDPDDRIRVLLEVLDENDHKAIVFVPFVSLLPVLKEHIEKDGWKVYTVSGQVPQSERSQIFSEFQDGPRGREVILAHPATMSHGLTLTAANLICWFGPIADLEIFQQANARIARPGQTHHTRIMQLAGSAAERRIYRQLRNKQDLQANLLKLFDE